MYRCKGSNLTRAESAWDRTPLIGKRSTFEFFFFLFFFFFINFRILNFLQFPNLCDSQFIGEDIRHLLLYQDVKATHNYQMRALIYSGIVFGRFI